MSSTLPVAEFVTASPAPPLRRYVAGYAGYRLEGFEPGVHRGLPSRHLTFIVSLGAPVVCTALAGAWEEPVQMHAFVSGLHPGPATIVHDGNQVGVALELTPAGVQALFGMPAAEVASVMVDLGDLVGPLAHEIRERLAHAGTWRERFDHLDRVLGAWPRRHEQRAVAADLAWAWERIVATGGGVEIAALARDAGWSRRHFGERFRREFGVSPKSAARIVRFERSRALLQRPDRPPLAAVAARCGFADQAHLARDWRDLAGCAPSVWLAEEELPSVQALDDVDVAS